MKRVFPYIKKLFVQSCICFTLMTLFLFLVGSAVPAFGNAIAVSTILSLYLFSLLLAAANLLLQIPQLKIGIRVLLHFIASIVAFYSIFVVVGMKITTQRATLTVLLLFTIFYALFMGLYLFLYFSFSANGRSTEQKAQRDGRKNAQT